MSVIGRVPSRYGFNDRHWDSCADAGRKFEAISNVTTVTVKTTNLRFRLIIPSNTFHYVPFFSLIIRNYSTDLR